MLAEAEHELTFGAPVIIEQLIEHAKGSRKEGSYEREYEEDYDGEWQEG